LVLVVVEVVVDVFGGVVWGGGGLGEEAVLGEGFVEGSLGGGFVALEEEDGVVVVVALCVLGEHLGCGLEREEGRGLGGSCVGVGLGAVEGGLVAAEEAVVFVAGVLAGGGGGVIEKVGFGLGGSAELVAEEGDAFD
jgi:hypothetical protein